REAITDARRKEREKIEEERRNEDLAKRIRRIMQDLMEDLDTAVGNRDALAYVEAQKRAARELRDLEEDRQEDEQRRIEDKAQEERWRAEDRAFAAADRRRRQQDEDADRALRLRRQLDAQQREDYYRQLDYNTRLNNLRNQVNQETGLYNVLQQQVTSSLRVIAGEFTSFINSLSGDVARLPGSGSGGGGGGGGGAPPLFPGIVGFSNWVDRRVDTRLN